MEMEYLPSSEAAPAYNSLLPLCFIVFPGSSVELLITDLLTDLLIARTTLKPNTSQMKICFR